MDQSTELQELRAALQRSNECANRLQDEVYEWQKKWETSEGIRRQLETLNAEIEETKAEIRRRYDKASWIAKRILNIRGFRRP